MKIVSCLLLTTSIAFASNLNSQNARVTIDRHKAPLTDILSDIEEQTDYLFVSNRALNLEREVSVNAKNRPVRDVLDQVLEGADMTYVAEGVNIILTQRQAARPEKSTPASNAVRQQQKRISGTVTDNGGEPIVGANVIEKGTTNGVITDVDGRFTINAGDNAVITVSYVGYVQQEITVGNRSTINVRLQEDARTIDEVVVVGYGVQKKANLTGAVAKVTAAEMENRPVSNVSQILQGSMPNVNITFPTGEPGSGGNINIRGIASINGGDPLVLVDGVPGDINRINPRDIESVSVLKDAAASAIYGARGAFGVILITTKNAQAGKTTLSYGAFFASSSITVSTDFMTTGYDHVMLNDEAFRRATGNTYTRYSEEDYEELKARRYDSVENPDRPWVVVKNVNGRDIYNYYGNYDWWNTVFNSSQPSQTHNINLSGGNDKLNFLISGNVYTKDGIMKLQTDKFRSYNFRSKINAQLLPFLSISNNTSYYDKSYAYYGREGGGNPNFVSVTVHALPAYAPMNPDGTATYNTLKNNYSIGDGLFANLIDGNSRGVKGIHEFTTTTSLKADVSEHLKLNADYTFSFYIADDWYRSTVARYSIQPGILQEVPNYNTDQLKKEMWFDPMHVFNT